MIFFWINFHRNEVRRCFIAICGIVLGADVTDINAANLNKEGNLLATGDDYGFVKLFDFPSKVGLFIVILKPHLYLHEKGIPLRIQLGNSFHVIAIFLYLLKTSKKLWFLMFSGGIEKTSGMKWVKEFSQHDRRNSSGESFLGC